MNMNRRTTALLTAGIVGLGLTGCSNYGGDEDGGGSGGGPGEGKTITMGYLPSWSDGLSMAYLMENQLEEMGYEVEHEELNDAAVIYAGLDNGDIDMYPSAWPEETHKEYAAEYEGGFEDVGAYYDNATLNLSVPTYMEDINSIEDLVGQGDRFGGTIYGIEPGAGLTANTQDSVMPEYGLDGEYELSTSSTTSMLTELKNKTENEEDVLVTLWTPFWANTTYPVKALEDPRGAYPDPESLHFLGAEGFAEDFPEAAEWISEVKLTDEQYGELENLVVNEYDEGEEAEAVQQWIDDNPDVLPELPEAQD